MQSQGTPHRVVLFDMDGTLVRVNTAKLYIRYEYDQGRVPFSRVLRVMYWYAWYTTGYINADDLAERALAWYRGRACADIEAEMHSWFVAYVRQWVTDAARHCVEAHRARGDTLAIATGAAKYATSALASHLGIDHLICSEVETHEGRLTGKLNRPACVGHGKVSRVTRWLASVHPELSLADVTFYSDSITDLPLLERVGSAVVVNPDLRLRWLARRRGWPILDW